MTHHELAEKNCGRKLDLYNERDLALVQLQELCCAQCAISIENGIITLESGESLNLHKIIHTLSQ
jgi:hypothetical protein